MSLYDKISHTSKELIELTTKKGIKIATAESCTGGLLASSITDVPGSSEVFYYGFITYANEAKVSILGVKEETISSNGAVSEEVVREMAEGAIRKAKADISCSITGIAGPSGGTPEKPVGLVYIGLSCGGKTYNFKNNFSGSRREVKEQTCLKALEYMIKAINGELS